MSSSESFDSAPDSIKLNISHTGQPEDVQGDASLSSHSSNGDLSDSISETDASKDKIAKRTGSGDSPWRCPELKLIMVQEKSALGPKISCLRRINETPTPMQGVLEIRTRDCTSGTSAELFYKIRLMEDYERGDQFNYLVQVFMKYPMSGFPKNTPNFRNVGEDVDFSHCEPDCYDDDEIRDAVLKLAPGMVIIDLRISVYRVLHDNGLQFHRLINSGPWTSVEDPRRKGDVRFLLPSWHCSKTMEVNNDYVCDLKSLLHDVNQKEASLLTAYLRGITFEEVIMPDVIITSEPEPQSESESGEVLLKPKEKRISKIKKFFSPIARIWRKGNLIEETVSQLSLKGDLTDQQSEGSLENSMQEEVSFDGNEASLASEISGHSEACRQSKISKMKLFRRFLSSLCCFTGSSQNNVCEV